MPIDSSVSPPERWSILNRAEYDDGSAKRVGYIEETLSVLTGEEALHYVAVSFDLSHNHFSFLLPP